MEAHPVSTSQGPVRSLPAKMERLLSEPLQELREREKHKIHLLKDHLQQLIGGYLLEPSEVEFPALTAKCWVEEVRELSYDIDDFLDELVHANAAHKKLRGQIARFRQGRSRSRWVADEVSGFVAHLEEAMQRHRSYNLVTHTRRPTTSSVHEHPLLPPPYGVEAAGFVGVDSSLDRLDEWITDEGERRLRVASIVGFAGVGKTTLAKQLYNRLGWRFDCRAFVRSSQKPDMKKLLTSILVQVRPHRPPDALESCNLASTIKAHLRNKKYFIVIDDIWASSTWDIVHQALPDDNCFSRILTTTEVDVVAHKCCGHNSKHIFKMEPLSKEKSSELFFSIFVGKQSEFPSFKKKISSEIISKSGGFPLATIATASLLATQPNTIEQWNCIWNSLSSINLKTNPTIEGMKHVLGLCYSNLPDHLKTCMLYLSLYPEDHIICKDELVKQWITEGFICAKEGKNMEEVASTYFDELVTRGMIQPVDINHNGEVLSCTVHYLILQLIQCKSIEENFVIAIHHSETNIRLADKVRRLSLHFGDAEDAKPPEKLRLSQIRSLFFFGLFKSLPSIVEFRLLQVLILHLWGDQDNISFDLTTVSKLFRLRYFAIACNVTLNLQGQLQGLQYLETLKIDSRVSEVPQDVINLPRLLHLSLPGNTVLPSEIGRMASLEIFGCYDLSSNSAGNVLSLCRLTNLRDLRLTCSTIPCDNLEEKVGHLASVMSKLRNLKSLTMLLASSSNASTWEVSASSNNISFVGLSNMSSPPALIEKLELSPRIGIFPRLPRWIGELGNLSILNITAREVWQSDIDILKKLNALAALSLYVRTTPAERIVFDKEGFPVLKHFKFICSALFIAFKKGALPNVRRLKLGFNANRLEQYSPAYARLENLTGLAVFSAKIGCAGAAESGRRAVQSALDDAFSNCVRVGDSLRRPVISVQWVDWIFDGDKEMMVSQTEQPRILGQADVVKKGGSHVRCEIGGNSSTEDTNRQDDSRIILPPESPSHMQNPEGLDKAGKPATVMENAMVSVSTGAMNSLLMKLETLTGERYAELTGTAGQGLILKDELQAMNALLKQLSNMADPNMNKCRNQMRELTYDIEDSIDDLMVHFVNNKGSGSQKRDIMPHDFIDQIQKLKAQVKEADLRSMVCKTERMGTFARSYMAREQWLSEFYDKGNGLVGMDGRRDELVRRLIGGAQDKLEGVCILGAAGIGKTTLATQVYNEIKRRFDSSVFISASKKVDSSDKDRMARLCTSILSQLQGNNNIQDTDKANPSYGVRRYLQAKRFLIVVDGVWSAQILEDIKVILPENNPGSRIITTTHISDVAESCGKQFSSFMYPMEPLTFEESLCLFRSIIFGSGRSCPIALEKDREEIVKACGGIPLAVRVIAGALSIKQADMEQAVAFRKIKKQEGMDHFNNVEWIREILDIGYSDLSCDMKTCLLYLSAFPENHVIRKDRLIRRWAAEGFLTKLSEETWWETGESYFLELIARKLVEPVYDEEDVLPIGCRISGSIYDFIESLSSQENIVKSDVTDETCMQHGVFRRLSVDLGSDNQEKPLVLLQGALSSKVRSLTVLGDFRFGWMPDLSAFKHVRVLDLEDTKGLENKQPESIGRLPLLRYLGLGGTNVTKLPPQIMALEQLTTLDLRRTRVRNLPTFGETTLVSLLAEGLIIPRRMEGMQKLEEVSKVLLGRDGSLVDDVAGLVNKLRWLRMLGVRFGRLYCQNEADRRGVKHFLEEVVDSNLQSLFLDNYLHALFDLLVDSWAHKRPPHLRKFELRMPSCLPQVPQEMASLIALTHLHIGVSEVDAQGVRALGNLPSLVLLKLHSDSSPTFTVSSKDGFQCLKVFWYDCQCGGAMGLRFEAGAMPQLRRLRLDFNVRETMSKHGHFDFGIQRLSLLGHVRATMDCARTSTASEVEAAEAHIRDQVSQNPNNPVLELNRRGHGHLTPHRGQLSVLKAEPPAEGSVIEIHSLDEYSMMTDDPKKLVVIDFSASWCGPSRMMAPVFADLSIKFPDVVFLKVDVDEMKPIAEHFSVEGMPTFLFLKGGAIMDKVVGAEKEELEEKLHLQIAMML